MLKNSVRIHGRSTCYWTRWCAKPATPSSGWKTVQTVAKLSLSPSISGVKDRELCYLANVFWGTFFEGSLPCAKRNELNFGWKQWVCFSRNVLCLVCSGCGMTEDVHAWGREGFGVFLFATELRRAPDHIRKQGLVKERLYTFYLEMAHLSKATLVSFIPRSRREPYSSCAAQGVCKAGLRFARLWRKTTTLVRRPESCIRADTPAFPWHTRGLCPSL